MIVQRSHSFQRNVPLAVAAGWIASQSSSNRFMYIERLVDLRISHAASRASIYGSRNVSSASHPEDRQGTKYERFTAEQKSRNKHGNSLKQQWTVPRTNLNHYPEETRKIIQQKQPATTMTNGQHTGDSTRKEVLLQSLEKCQAAIEYERYTDYADFVGRNGEHFSSWMSSHLKEFDTFVSSYPEVFNLDEYVTLLSIFDGEYLELDSKKQRQKIVEDCEQMLLSIHNQLVKVSRSAVESLNKGLKTSHVDREDLPKEQKVPKLSTADFRNTFMQRALEAHHVTGGIQGPQNGINDLQGNQRSDLWNHLRSSRLTASAFSKALGFFAGDRVSLWEEKIGVREPFKGNDATTWGTVNEPRALLTYENLTGQKVEPCMFKVKKDDVVHDWLGASPDGLVAGLGLLQEQTLDPSKVDPLMGLHPKGPGILEIKCPYNKGRPDLAEPPTKAIWYYMPQIQGLMDVFDREWCILYVWTSTNGSASFIISRDRQYWSTCFDVLAEFWWAHTVPARQIRSLHDDCSNMNMGDQDSWVEFRPSEVHPKSEMLKEWSKRMAWSSPGKIFPHVELISSH